MSCRGYDDSFIEVVNGKLWILPRQKAQQNVNCILFTRGTLQLDMMVLTSVCAGCPSLLCHKLNILDVCLEETEELTWELFIFYRYSLMLREFFLIFATEFSVVIPLLWFARQSKHSIWSRSVKMSHSPPFWLTLLQTWTT